MAKHTARNPLVGRSRKEVHKVMGATIETEAPQAVAQEADARKMFQYSAYLDVGDGAEECEHSRDGQCKNNEHFHAWCRLPNPYQHQDIRAKGMAAKARKIRELKDPDSDASVILDETLGVANDEIFRSQIVDELLAREWANDYLEAQRLVDEDERFAHIYQDREEFKRLDATEGALAEEEQSEEYKRLSQHIETYLAELRAKLESIQGPKRDELNGRSMETLVGLVRAQRVEEASDNAFMDTYTPWMWFVGTFQVEPHPETGRPHLPMWQEIGHRDRAAAGTMFGEAPEVIDALKTTFDQLQFALQRGSAGN